MMQTIDSRGYATEQNAQRAIDKAELPADVLVVILAQGGRYFPAMLPTAAQLQDGIFASARTGFAVVRR